MKKNKLLLIGFVLIILVIIVLIFFTNTRTPIVQIKQIIYDVSSIDLGVKTNIGQLTVKYSYNVDGITIEENKRFSGNFFSSSPSSIDIIDNKKIYIYKKNYELMEVIEDEVVNEKQNINFNYKISNKKDHVDVKATLYPPESVMIAFPKSEVKISGYFSSIYSLLSDRDWNKDKYHFFYNIKGYMDRYRVMDEEFVDNKQYGKTLCTILEYTGESSSKFWVEQSSGIVIQREDELSKDYKVLYNLISVDR